MTATWPAWLPRFRSRSYGRRPPLVLINGLAEQAESWYRNHYYWRRYFDVHMPNILVYDGPAIQERIAQDQPITVSYLVEQLHLYLSRFAQNPPFHLVSSSLGGKVAVEFAVRHPDLVGRVVLLCPSGMGDEEQLPIMAGIRRSDMRALVESVFYNPRRHADGDMIRFYRRQMPNRCWRLGLLRTVRGTLEHTVRTQLKHLHKPTLLVTGQHDRICCPSEARAAAGELPNGQFLMVPKCGHAPQIEKARFINRVIVRFLTHPNPIAHSRHPQLILGSPKT